MAECLSDDEDIFCDGCGEFGKKEQSVIKCDGCGSKMHETYNFDTGVCEVKMTKRCLGCPEMLPCTTEYEFAEANCTCGPNQETMATCPKHSDAWYAWLTGEEDDHGLV